MVQDILQGSHDFNLKTGFRRRNNHLLNERTKGGTASINVLFFEEPDGIASVPDREGRSMTAM